MKYNKSEIMKTAWAIRRETNCTMSQALKAAWAKAKEAKTMRGSAKQIAWAEEIKTNIENTFNGFLADAKKHPANPVLDGNINYVNERLNALNAADYAGDIIDLFKGVRFTGDHQKDFMPLISAYRAADPNTAGEKKLLCI